jgi:hypothetical protein
MTAEARFWAKVDTSGDGCWIWGGYIGPSGYGRAYAGPSYYRAAHRMAYEFARGPIPEGLQIDHLCRNRACVKPDHLEAVTQTENVRRGLRGRLLTVCAKGHDYTPENTYTSPAGNRACRKCRTARSNARNSDPQRIEYQKVYEARYRARRKAERKAS